MTAHVSSARQASFAGFSALYERVGAALLQRRWQRAAGEEYEQMLAASKAIPRRYQSLEAVSR